MCSTAVSHCRARPRRTFAWSSNRSLDVLEEAQVFTDWLFSFLSAQDAYFKYKLRAWPALVSRKLLAPLKRLLFRFDDLSR